VPTSSERADLTGALTTFLGEHTPFQAMSDDELAELAAGSTVVEFPAAAVVADYATRVPDDVWMVHTGNVALHASGDGMTIDSVGPGGIFGFMPLLAGGGMDFEARTTVPSTLIRLPGALVRAQFAKPAGLAFLASSAWNLGTTDRPTIAPATDSRPVADFVHGEVLLVRPDTSVRDAVVQMTEHRVSYALVRLPDGALGIFTDRDLRTRVVAAGLPVNVPIGGVMSAPARTVTADLTADTVLIEMLECGLRHMPVVTSRGEVVGVLEDADLLAASARQSLYSAAQSAWPPTRLNYRGSVNASRAWQATYTATEPRRRRRARSCPSSSTAWCARRSNWPSPKPITRPAAALPG
jgi:CBS domain-containing protein